MSVATETKLISPHGGTLIDRTGERPNDLDALEVVTLASRELSDLDMIASGALSPLEGFMGGAVIAAAISPYRDTRAKARAMVEEFGRFVEVFVATSLDECARRDVNGLYKKAFAGEITGFTGVDDPYEEPESAEVVVETEGKTPEESAQVVIEKLEELGLVPSAVAA